MSSLQTVNNLKLLLAKSYQTQINNYFGDEKKALKFLSSVMASVQRTPELLNCDAQTVINSFMVMAQLELMPSGVSGEAYVLPYNDKKLGKIAQFQIGYQGLVTLFYRAGVKSITSEIVYEKDKFSYVNGVIEHNPDVFADDRGKAIGAYVIVETQQGGKISKVMKKKDILGIGEKFSKSYFGYDYQTKKKTNDVGEYTPWNEKNDPELWMWKKTVLKQIAKLVPKNETIYKAIDEDNKDSIIAERQEAAMKEAESLRMGNLLKSNNHEEADTNQTENDPAKDN